MANDETLKNDAQVTSGLRSILSSPVIFNIYQWLIGSDDFMKRYVSEYIKPKPNDKIIDIGCGTAQVLKFLPEDVNYTGYDLSIEYLSYASKKYKDRGKFFCKRISNSMPNEANNFDIALAGAVLHHIDNKEARKLFSEVKQLLKPNGYLVAYDGTYIENQSKIARYILSKDRGKHVRTPEQYESLAKEFFLKVETHIIHNMYKIPYTGFIMKCFKS